MVKYPPVYSHPAAILLASYASKYFPAEVGTPYPLKSIKAAIKIDSHASTMKSNTKKIIREEILLRAKRGFSIILFVKDTLNIFGNWIRISCLASVDQKNCKPRLIFNSIATSDSITSSVNTSTYLSSNPKKIQFRYYLPHFLQKI